MIKHEEKESGVSIAVAERHHSDLSQQAKQRRRHAHEIRDSPLCTAPPGHGADGSGEQRRHDQRVVRCIDAGKAQGDDEEVAAGATAAAATFSTAIVAAAATVAAAGGVVGTERDQLSATLCR